MIALKLQATLTNSRSYVINYSLSKRGIGGGGVFQAIVVAFTANNT